MEGGGGKFFFILLEDICFEYIIRFLKVLLKFIGYVEWIKNKNG